MVLKVDIPNIQDLRLYSEEEVADAAGSARVLVIIYDLVYDLTEFLDIHPGGAEIIYEMNGLDATSVFEDVGHSKLARTILIPYVVGRVLREKKIPDHVSQPLMHATQNIRF